MAGCVASHGVATAITSLNAAASALVPVLAFSVTAQALPNLLGNGNFNNSSNGSWIAFSSGPTSTRYVKW
jgi:hypothetical protein